MPEPLLTVENLTVEFALQGQYVRAVNDVSFSLDRGEVLAVVGESGCGKSVTALSLMRLVPEPPARTSGRILFGGEDLRQLREKAMRAIRGRRIAMIFQDPLSSLNPVLTIGFQVAEVIALHRKLPMKVAWEGAVEMLGRVGIPDPELRAHSYPHQISGGQRQRAMIAMAFACEPELVIADEPTTALDVTVQRQVLDLMLDLRRERGTSILLITHDLGVVAEAADRVQVMYAGRIVETADVKQLFAAPAHPYTQALLASVPRLDTERSERLPMIPGQPPDLLSMPIGCPFQPRCPHAHDRCREMPDWSTVAPNHEARCWLLQERG
jgi:oligopeptide/dipeptide ABC transporter ATP-binding protein